MIQGPKSLTATVHVRFHYTDPEVKPLVEGETAIMSKLLENVADLPQEMQEILFKFANYLKEASSGDGHPGS